MDGVNLRNGEGMGCTRKERRRIVGMKEGRRGGYEWEVVIEVWRRDERKGKEGEEREGGETEGKRREEEEEYICETRMEEKRRGRDNVEGRG